MSTRPLRDQARPSPSDWLAFHVAELGAACLEYAEGLVSTDIAVIEEALPLGFHDADLTSFGVDYVAGRAAFALGVIVGFEPERDGDFGRMPILRRCVLTFDDVEYVVVPAPDVVTESENRTLDVGGSLGVPDDEGVPAPGEGFVAYSFYVSNWNRCLVVSAKRASFAWVEDHAASR